MKYLHEPLESKSPVEEFGALPGQWTWSIGVVGVVIGAVGFICSVTFGGGSTYCQQCYQACHENCEYFTKGCH